MHLTANAGSEGVNNVPDCCSSSTYSRWEGHTSSRKTSQGCQHRLLGGGYMHLTANAGGQVGDTCFMHLTANTGGQVGGTSYMHLTANAGSQVGGTSYMHLTANAGGQVGDTCLGHLTANTGGQVGYLPATCTIRPTQAVRQLGGGAGYVRVGAQSTGFVLVLA